MKAMNSEFGIRNFELVVLAHTFLEQFLLKNLMLRSAQCNAWEGKPREFPAFTPSTLRGEGWGEGGIPSCCKVRTP